MQLEPSKHPIKLNRVRIKSFAFHGHNLDAIDARQLPSLINVQRSIPEPQLEVPSDASKPEMLSGFYKVSVGFNNIDGTTTPDTTQPYSIEVWLYAEFVPDYQRMQWDAVKNWLLNFSEYVIYPYMRSALYTIATQAGVEAPMLPLFEVPTFKMDQAPPTTP